MILYEWEVWNTYSSFLTGEQVDLFGTAEALVEQNLAECAMHSGGRTYLRTHEGIRRGQTTFRPNTSRTRASVNLAYDDGLDGPRPTRFAAETFRQASTSRFAEHRVFLDEEDYFPEYVRAHMGQCNLINTQTGVRIRCYPAVKLYSSGVILVSFRVLSPNRPTGSKAFILNYVTTARKGFERIEVPPALVRIASQASSRAVRSSLVGRLGLLRAEREYAAAIQRATRVDNEGDFPFRVVPLFTESPDNLHTLTELAHTIVAAVGFIASAPRSATAFALKGETSIRQMGGFYMGRVNCHLVRFEDQAATARENERRFGGDLGWMIAGGWFRPRELGRQYLPPNSRTLQDYGAYIDFGASLWVWTTRMLEEQDQTAIGDPRNIIYEHQSIVDFLEYGYMLHRALLDGATGPATWPEVLRRRRALLGHTIRLDETSHFGEIRTLLRNGWNLMGLPEVRERIHEALSIRQDEATTTEARRGERTGWALTILFGFLAVPTLASEVLVPLWRHFGPSVSVDSELLKLAAIGVAAVGIAALTWSLLRRREV